MEQKDRSVTRMFLVILILGFASGFLRNSFVFLLDLFNDLQIAFSPFFQVINYLNLVIIYGVVFVVFYQMGKKIDLKLKLDSLIIRLLAGAVIGNFLGFNIALLLGGFYYDFGIFENSIINILLYALPTFLTAFTALAIAYIRHTDRMDSEPPLPRTDVEVNL